MSRKGSWDDDGSSLSESLLRFVHGGDEANPPTPRSVTQALALTPATRERRNSDLDELTFYYSPEEPGVRGEVRVGLDRSVDRYDEDDDDDALVNGGGASFASWRDVPRRLEEVEGSVEDCRRRLLSLELHGRRRAREDSANVAVGLPGPRMRACLQTASLTCLRLNRTVDWNRDDPPTATKTNLAPPPSPPASTFSQTYSQTEASSFSCAAVARPPEIIALFASRIAQHVESDDPAPSHVASCARYAAYHAARSIRARVDRVFASMSSDSESDQSKVSTSASDGRCETGSASGYLPGGESSSSGSAESFGGGDDAATTTKRGKERARRLLHRSGRRAIVVDFGDRARAADDATAA